MTVASRIQFNLWCGSHPVINILTWSAFCFNVILLNIYLTRDYLNLRTGKKSWCPWLSLPPSVHLSGFARHMLYRSTYRRDCFCQLGLNSCNASGLFSTKHFWRKKKLNEMSIKPRQVVPYWAQPTAWCLATLNYPLKYTFLWDCCDVAHNNYPTTLPQSCFSWSRRVGRPVPVTS